MEAHRCPAIAHIQLGAGGTVGGVSVTTVGEAEVFAQYGIRDVYIANEVITPMKIARLCGLAHHTRITVATDSAKNVEDLSAAAKSAGVTLNVAVDVHTRIERCGVEPGKPAADLAAAIAKADNLEFAGIMAYEGVIITGDIASETKKAIQPVLDTREMIEKQGLAVKSVSVGGTHNYEIVAKMSGVTEVPAGAYALMDHKYAGTRTGLRNAASIITTVISHPLPGKAITDCGQKAMGVDLGMPVVTGFADAKYVGASAEHGHIDLDGDAQKAAAVGDKFWLTPFDIGTAVNNYDYIHAIRGGKLEAVWDVPARGRYR
jgi:3-hydroxy-D-aspartate aldolase